MIVAVSRFRVSASEADAIEERFRARSRRVDLHAGFLGLEVLRGVGSEPEFLLITRWENRLALSAYLRSDDFRAVHARGDEQAAEFRIYELVAT